MNSFFARNLLFKPVLFLKRENLSKYYNFYLQSQWYNPNTILLLQKEKLKFLLEFALKKNTFIKKILIANKIYTINEFNHFPPIKKSEVQLNYREIVSDKKFPFHSIKTTGGSTGEPLMIYKNNEAMAAERAALWRGYNWAGASIGDKQARFWGVPLNRIGILKSKIIDYVNNRKRLSAFKFDTKNLTEYVNIINNFKPKYYYGYVSLIKEFSKYLIDNNIRLRTYPISVITTAEELHESDRVEIEFAFQCKVFNEYGSGEIGTIAHECEYGKMHINEENVLVEILDDEGRILSEGKGELLVTELNNVMMPLIRYRIGDNGEIYRGNCDCGRKLLILNNVFGRKYDIVKSADGKHYHPSFFNYIFKDIKNQFKGISQYQVIQQSLEDFDINMIVKTEFDKNGFEKLFIKLMETKFNTKLRIRFHYLKNIPREKSGKFRLVKSNVK
jgi:phenylacetate-coenzyme A ligase PaaK-like adenylate-forming protein